MKKFLVLLTLLALTLGFSGSALAYPASPNQDVGPYGKPKCFAVSGELDMSANSDTFTGSFSGDIEGEVTSNAGSMEIFGVAIFRSVEQTWQVNGGTVEVLIGETLYLEGDFVGKFARPPLVITSATLRVVDSAYSGSMTIHGTFDAATLINHSKYYGVLCP